MSSTRPKAEDQSGSRQPSAPRTRRGTSPKKREQEILDAAAEIFHRQGYSDTSVQNVADAVGILKGSLYYYIDSKDDLLYRVLLEVHGEAVGIIEDVAAMSELTPIEKLDAYLRRHVEYNTQNLTKIAVYYHDHNQLAPERRERIRQQRRIYEDFVEGLIRDGQELGEIDSSFDPRILAYCLFGAANWIYTWYRPGGRVSAETLSDTIASFILDGIRAK
jgi:AcrR family transcriptional regulator